jgi:phosphoglycerate dehydrogenase-like enzyme
MLEMKLMLTGAFKYSKEQMEKLKLLGFDIVFVQDERVPLQIEVSDIDAVVCNSLFLYNDIKKFKNLKFIQLTSAGLDRVPLDYIKDQGIKLFNAKGVYSIPMAEWVVLKILEIYKKSRYFYEAQLQHKWEKQRELLELTDKTATIIGFGDVGTEVAKRLKGFGVKVIGIGRRKIISKYIDEYYYVNQIDYVLRKSDIVILTIPLTKETTHLIDINRIRKMKDNSVLINVSRGGVIDEVALIEALQSGKFLGVALDVFDEEPLREGNPLWNFDRLLITPHNSFLSEKVNQRLFKLVMENLKDFKSDVKDRFGGLL